MSERRVINLPIVDDEGGNFFYRAIASQQLSLEYVTSKLEAVKNLSRALTFHDESWVRFVEVTVRMRDDKYRRCESRHSDKQDAGRRKSRRRCRCEV